MLLDVSSKKKVAMETFNILFECTQNNEDFDIKNYWHKERERCYSNYNIVKNNNNKLKIIIK